MAKKSDSGVSKRRWKRYHVKNGAFVMIYRPSLLKLGKPVLVKLGPIKDIGMKGLAVQYMDQKNLLRNVNELAIALPDGSIAVDKIKFSPVTDFEVAQLPNDRTIRTLCVSFPGLLPMQKIQLERFIDEHTVEMVMPPR
jgi:hypothetical protein